MKNFFIIISTLTLVCCNTAQDYSKEISMLDSLHVLITQIEPEFIGIDKKKIKPAVDSVMADLKYIEENYEGNMREDLGKLFSDYRTIIKLLPDFNKRYNRTEKEIEATKIQLTNLKIALAKGATQDSAGNKITQGYVQKAFGEEKMMAESLIGEMIILTERSATLAERYDSLRPLVKFYVDSIPQKIKQ